MTMSSPPHSNHRLDDACEPQIGLKREVARKDVQLCAHLPQRRSAQLRHAHLQEHLHFADDLEQIDHVAGGQTGGARKGFRGQSSV